MRDGGEDDVPGFDVLDRGNDLRELGGEVARAPDGVVLLRVEVAEVVTTPADLEIDDRPQSVVRTEEHDQRLDTAVGLRIMVSAELPGGIEQRQRFCLVRPIGVDVRRGAIVGVLDELRDQIVLGVADPLLALRVRQAQGIPEIPAVDGQGMVVRAQDRRHPARTALPVVLDVVHESPAGEQRQSDLAQPDIRPELGVEPSTEISCCTA